MISTADPGLEKGIQLRADQLFEVRPDYPLGCRTPVHRHGGYCRYSEVSGNSSVLFPRFLCSSCRVTISILPAHLLPYRHIHASRFEAFADRQAGMCQEPDPPPDEPDAAMLRRAWGRFGMQFAFLRFCLGDLNASGVNDEGELWITVRKARQSFGVTRLFLARSHNPSLLDDYHCLRPASH